MPCIQTKVNIPISPEKEKVLKTKFGKAISLLPGKSEGFLMLTFEDNCRMYFQGSDEPGLAFVEVKLFGKAAKDAYSALTAEITSVLQQELGINPAKVYVKYEETANWGWNGSNF